MSEAKPLQRNTISPEAASLHQSAATASEKRLQLGYKRASQRSSFSSFPSTSFCYFLHFCPRMQRAEMDSQPGVQSDDLGDSVSSTRGTSSNCPRDLRDTIDTDMIKNLRAQPSVASEQLTLNNDYGCFASSFANARRNETEAAESTALLRLSEPSCENQVYVVSDDESDSEDNINPARSRCHVSENVTSRGHRPLLLEAGPEGNGSSSGIGRCRIPR